MPAREFGPPGIKSDPGCFERLAREGYQQHVAYMPASRYWTLQWIETAGFFVLAGPLLGGMLLVDSPPRVLTSPTAGPMRRRSSPH